VIQQVYMVVIVRGHQNCARRQRDAMTYTIIRSNGPNAIRVLQSSPARID